MRALVRQRGPPCRRKERPFERRSRQVRELPALRGHVPDPGSRRNRVAPGGQWVEQLDARRYAGYRQTGANRCGAPFVDGKPAALSHLLGSSAAQREPGDEPVHRSVARADGDPRVSRKPPR